MNTYKNFLCKAEAISYYKMNYAMDYPLSKPDLGRLYQLRRGIASTYMDPDGKSQVYTYFDSVGVTFNWREFCSKNSTAENEYDIKIKYIIALEYLFELAEYNEYIKCYTACIKYCNNAGLAFQAIDTYNYALPIESVGKLAVCNMLAFIKALREDKNLKLRRVPWADYIECVAVINNSMRQKIFNEPFIKEAYNSINRYILTNSKAKLIYEEYLQKKAKQSLIENVETVIDRMENDPIAVKNFLENFDNGTNTGYWTVKNSNDYRVIAYKNHFSNEPERLTEIFKNYLYSQFSRTRKVEALTKELHQINEVYNIFETGNFTFFNVIEDLPDVIRTYALKSILGD